MLAGNVNNAPFHVRMDCSTQVAASTYKLLKLMNAVGTDTAPTYFEDMPDRRFPSDHPPTGSPSPRRPKDWFVADFMGDQEEIAKLDMEDLSARGGNAAIICEDHMSVFATHIPVPKKYKMHAHDVRAMLLANPQVSAMVGTLVVYNRCLCLNVRAFVGCRFLRYGHGRFFVNFDQADISI